LYTYDSGTLNTAIPDATVVDGNNVYHGINFSTVPAPSGIYGIISDVTVTLNISGGYNGDLYGYLILGNTPGTSPQITLLNRVGLTVDNTDGYGNTGFAITLSDAGTAGLHLYQEHGGELTGQLTGTWQPDSGDATFNSVFYGQNPNNTWTLFLEDESPGGQSTLISWSLDVTAVPEPVNVALAIFGVLFAGFGLGRRFCARSRQ